MQRIVPPVLALVFAAGGTAAGQQAAGSTLWRVAATTLPTPPALATGAAAAFWNPAQVPESTPPKLQLAFEAIQTPSAVDANGIIATVRTAAGRLGQVGLIYGRVGLSDLTQTIDSPDPTGATIPVYTFAIGATWARRIAGTDLGATLASHEVRLDASRSDRWTFDFGASRQFMGDRLRLALATHFFSSLKLDDPAHDLYAGVEARLWQGPISDRHDQLVVRGRYGVAFGHGFAADHQLGAGAEFARKFSFDLMVAREGGYSSGAQWRPVGGLGVTIGKYRVTLARDAGVNDVGSAYRVGVEATFK
jgi:hypothetical protein